MKWAQSTVWACGLAALGLAIGVGHAQSPPNTAPKPNENKAAPHKDSREAEIEALKKEIEALRKKVDALSKTEDRHEPRKVVVTNPSIKDVVITQRYAAKIHAHRHINLQALSTGYIAEIPIKEGQLVTKGEVLFKIVPVLYKAKLDAEMADVQLAQLELNSTKKLFETNVVTKNEVALFEAKLAKAQAKAKLAQAELNFADIKAPFDGLVDRFQVQQGSLVREGDTLTTLSDNNVMWVYFNVPEARYLESMANQDQEKETPQFELLLANGKKFPQLGKLGAIAANFDNKSGTIPFRADFPNPKGLLRHGQSGTVLVKHTLKNAMVIPQQTTFQENGRRYVYVVGNDGVAHQREIDIQNEADGIFVVKKGLDVNDRIIARYLSQISDGEKVEPKLRKTEK